MLGRRTRTVGVFAIVVLIFWINKRLADSRLKTQAETQRLLLDKFGSGPDLVAFLQSPAGKSFLLPERKDPRARVLAMITPAMVLLVVGLGMIGLTIVAQGLMIPGVIILSLGVGFLVGGGISYSLAKRWGLFTEPLLGNVRDLA
jgi:hypothetical protein